MNPDDETDLPPSGRIGLGLLLLVGGATCIMASLDLGPLSSADVNGPPWLAAAVGGVFLLSGLLVAAGKQWRHHPLSHAIVFFILAGLAAIGNWIAFAPGPRVCRVEVPGLGSDPSSWMSGIGCRTAFGVGAVVMDGVLLSMLATGVQKRLGKGRAADFAGKIGEGVLLVCLSPILVPMVLILVLKSLYAVLREYASTGQDGAERPSSRG